MGSHGNWLRSTQLFLNCSFKLQHRNRSAWVTWFCVLSTFRIWLQLFWWPLLPKSNYVCRNVIPPFSLILRPMYVLILFCFSHLHAFHFSIILKLRWKVMASSKSLLPQRCFSTLYLNHLNMNYIVINWLSTSFLREPEFCLPHKYLRVSQNLLSEWKPRQDNIPRGQHQQRMESYLSEHILWARCQSSV